MTKQTRGERDVERENSDDENILAKAYFYGKEKPQAPCGSRIARQSVRFVHAQRAPRMGDSEHTATVASLISC